MYIISETPITDIELRAAILKSLEGLSPKKVLILPPDYTRMHSGAGKITAIYYELLKDNCAVDIMPALGTHAPMTKEECEAFFLGVVPYEKLIVHNWRTDIIKLGEVSGEFVSEVSEGLVNEKIDVTVNHLLIDGGYDLIISVGQVVPHEVVGMANYTKNILVGCGGASMINASHMLGAVFGMERIMGKDFSPVRRVLDYAEEHFLKNLPLTYVLTVTTSGGDEVQLYGLFIERNRRLFELAVAESQKRNMIHLSRPLEKVVVYLDGREFKSTWLGNKAIYRTRMAIAAGGELIILAPGVKMFGEDPENDRLIRKYGYRGRKKILELLRENCDLKDNLSVAAHLIHGSSDGRFSITYCTRLLTRHEVESVNFSCMPYEDAIKKYDPSALVDGFNEVCGEELFYISNPALGLWTAQEVKK